MMLPSISTLLMLGLAHGHISTSIISITTDDDKIYLGVHVENGMVRAARKPTTFKFDTAGTMKISCGEDYLDFDKSGILVVTSTPQGIFEKKARPGQVSNALVFNGTKEYQLCEDCTIGINSSCAGSRKATISIENLPVTE